MRCKKVQHWLLMRHETEPEDSRFMAHLETCTACRAFQKHVIALKRDLIRMELPEPSDALIQKTLDQCHEQIRLKAEANAHEIPKWILVGAGVWVLVTMTLITFGLLQSDSEWNIQKITALVLIIQNGLMLLFSPILLSSVSQSVHLLEQKRGNTHKVFTLSCL